MKREIPVYRTGAVDSTHVELLPGMPCATGTVSVGGGTDGKAGVILKETLSGHSNWSFKFTDEDGHVIIIRNPQHVEIASENIWPVYSVMHVALPAMKHQIGKATDDDRQSLGACYETVADIGWLDDPEAGDLTAQYPVLNSVIDPRYHEQLPPGYAPVLDRRKIGLMVVFDLIDILLADGVDWQGMIDAINQCDVEKDYVRKSMHEPLDLSPKGRVNQYFSYTSLWTEEGLKAAKAVIRRLT